MPPRGFAPAAVLVALALLAGGCGRAVGSSPEISPAAVTTRAGGPASDPAGGIELVDSTGGTPARRAAVLGAAARAVASVRAVWGPRWSLPAVVVLVPGSAALAEATGRTAAGVRGLVAVTERSGVYVDATALGGLTSTSQVVLLTHEATHLATGAPESAASPLWLEEGFADWVAFRSGGVPASVAAADLLSSVRAGSLPDGLPEDSAFAAGSPGIGAAYAGAWLACTVLARALGTRGLVAFYRAVAAGHGSPTANVSAALRATTGWSVPALVRAWRTRLRELAA